MEISVPLGTVVAVRGDISSCVVDCVEEGTWVLVAHGGTGGRGNRSFATSAMQVPRLAEAGEPGETRQVELDYKMPCDVAILGLPNAGKSQLLNRLSDVQAKVADYPITTVEPIVGVVELKWRQYRLVELPALWATGQGTSAGTHIDLLKHAERAKVLLLCIDAASSSLMDNYSTMDTLVEAYGRGLPGKCRVVVLNKADLLDDSLPAEEVKDALESMGVECFLISALNGEGVQEAMIAVAAAVDSAPEAEAKPQQAPEATFKPQPKEAGVVVEREGSTFVVHCLQVERVVSGTDLGDWEARVQVMSYMERAGVQRALEKAGVRPGDTVWIGETEMQWE